MNMRYLSVLAVSFFLCAHSTKAQEQSAWRLPKGELKNLLGIPALAYMVASYDQKSRKIYDWKKKYSFDAYHFGDFSKHEGLKGILEHSFENEDGEFFFRGKRVHVGLCMNIKVQKSQVFETDNDIFIGLPDVVAENFETINVVNLALGIEALKTSPKLKVSMRDIASRLLLAGGVSAAYNCSHGLFTSDPVNPSDMKYYRAKAFSTAAVISLGIGLSELVRGALSEGYWEAREARLEAENKHQNTVERNVYLKSLTAEQIEIYKGYLNNDRLHSDAKRALLAAICLPYVERKKNWSDTEYLRAVQQSTFGKHNKDLTHMLLQFVAPEQTLRFAIPQGGVRDFFENSTFKKRQELNPLKRWGRTLYKTPRA